VRKRIQPGAGAPLEARRQCWTCARQLPGRPDYYAGVGKAAYISALGSEKGIDNPTGLMPADGPCTCPAVLPAVK
jgi:hypothetical protein